MNANKAISEDGHVPQSPSAFPPSHSLTLGIWFTFVRLADPSWSVWVQTRGGDEGLPRSKQTLCKLVSKLVFLSRLLSVESVFRASSSKSFSICASFRFRNHYLTFIILYLSNLMHFVILTTNQGLVT